MFRAQQNAFDDAVGESDLFLSTLMALGLAPVHGQFADLLLWCVAKATDENLTSENWEYILVCPTCCYVDLFG